MSDRPRHTATFYAQVEPTWARWKRTDGSRALDSIRVTGITQNPPRRPPAGSVTVKLNLTLPAAVFETLRPEINIDVPADHVLVNEAVHIESDPIEVLANDDGA